MVASPSPAVKALNDQSPAFVTIPISLDLESRRRRETKFSLLFLFTTPNRLLNRDIYVCADVDGSKLNIFPSVFVSGLLKSTLDFVIYKGIFIQICSKLI